MSWLRSASYFRKNLISYIIIFFLPFLIFATIYQFRFKDILQDELIENNYRQLSALETTIDHQVQQVQEIVKQTLVSQKMSPFDFSEEPLKAMDRMELLHQYTSTNPFIEEMMLHYHGDEFIYSSTSSHLIDTIFEKIYQFEQWDHEQFISDIESIEFRTIRPRERVTVYTKREREYYTTMMFPLSNDGISHYGTLLFFVPESEILTMIETIYSPEDNSTFVIDSQNQLIASTHISSIFNPSNYTIYMDQLAEGQTSKIITVNGADYLITLSSSEETKWTYVNITSIDAALAVAIETQQQFTLISIGILLVGVLIISLMMSMNYSPIRKLLTMSNAILTDSDDSTGSEIDAIEDAIKFLSDKNSALSDVIDDTKIAAKEYVIGQLMSGQTMKREYMDSNIIKTIMNQAMNHYYVMIINIIQDDHIWSDMKEELIEDIENYSGEHTILFCKESIVTNSIAALCLSDSALKNNDSHLLEAIISNLSAKWKAEVTIGVGKRYTSLDELPKSYMGASTAIDYRLMVGNGSAIYYDEIVGNMKQITSYPYSDLELFKLSIKKGNADDVDMILNNIVNQFKANTVPIFIARGICYEIVNTVVKSYEELKQDHQELFQKYPDIFSITKYESIYKIIEIVKLISYDVCKALSNTYDNDNKILIANMNDYIEDNYMDSNFSLQSMADHYNTLPPNLSSFYKDNTGNNIFEEVTRLRMEAAGQLLTTSQLPINQICTKIGYDNVSSFIRRFKQFNGITPGHFRTLNAK